MAAAPAPLLERVTEPEQDDQNADDTDQSEGDFLARREALNELARLGQEFDADEGGRE